MADLSFARGPQLAMRGRVHGLQAQGKVLISRSAFHAARSQHLVEMNAQVTIC